jgi:CRISPR system Cascade subunit CasD
MTTLLLRLTGPMQSWGTQSRFTIRDTGREPSKSGVLGLVCAALGRPRDAPLDDLVRLKMGVRVDQEGVVKVDYQTAGGAHRQGEAYGVVRADGSSGDPVPSWRYYLADARFLVGLWGDEALLREIHAALAGPVWPIFLGRKSFVPGEPVYLSDGICPLALEEALHSYRPWPAGQAELRFVLDAESAEATDGREARNDVPLSFVSDNRRFDIRYVVTKSLARPGGTE